MLALLMRPFPFPLPMLATFVNDAGTTPSDSGIAEEILCEGCVRSALFPAHGHLILPVQTITSYMILLCRLPSQ